MAKGKRSASRKPHSGTQSKETVPLPVKSDTGHPSPVSRWLAGSCWAIPLILVVLCLGLYATSLPLGLVHFDDDVYISEDVRLQHLSLVNIGRIFSQPFFANYHPVTTLTYALDHAVWGDWLTGFRLTHLAFYAFGVVLLYYLYRSLLASVWGACAAAAIFAAHPLHVEAVAWLAQRKDVVCLVFYVGTVLCYQKYSQQGRRQWNWYALALFLAVMACLSKGYAVILPALLFAYDLCFAGRIGRRQVLDKVPFAAVSIAITIFTVLSQEEVKALVDLQFTVWERVFLLCQIFAVYIGKALVPVRLSPLYVVGKSWISGGWSVLGLFLVTGSAAGFFLLRKKRPVLAFSLALFMLPLFTVMNLFFTLRIWMADRYLFLPTIGTSLAVVEVVSRLMRRDTFAAGHRRAWAAGMMAAAIVILYSVLTVDRISVWRGPVDLWSDAVRKYSEVSGDGPVTSRELKVNRPRRISSRLITALAQAYGRSGNEEEARALLAMAEKPGQGDETGTELDFARIAIEEGRIEEGVRLARKVAEGGTWLAPRGWGMIGMAYAQQGNYDSAREAFMNSLEAYRKSGRSGADAMVDLGLLELRAGRPEKAAEWYGSARRLDTGNAAPVLGLAMTYEAMGRTEEALALYKEVLRIAPGHPQQKNIAGSIAKLEKSRGGNQDGR